MSNCNHDCSHCSEDCSSRVIEKLKPHEFTSIGKIYAIISGKGGVGKSLITSLIASNLSKKGYRVGIIDADVTGPSMPQSFGLAGKMAESDESGLYPVQTKTGIKVMSANLLMPNQEEPIVWRGPMIGSFVQQMFTDVIFGELDYLIIDMPPGTGDVPLTVFQMIPVDGIIVVTSPQDLVGMVVAKSINMAKMMNIPIVGVVENMAYLECPDCGKKINIYGKGSYKENVERQGLEIIAELPIDPSIAKLVDEGKIEDYETTALNKAVELIEKK